MQVILLEKIGKLGILGDTVNVKSGFGRNYLIPQGKAVMANKANIASFAERRAELEAAAAEKLAAAQARAEAMTGLVVNITSNAGDEGKLFGSIGTKDIADAISAANHPVDKADVRLPLGSIRNVGTYPITIQLHSDVNVEVSVAVVAE